MRSELLEQYKQAKVMPLVEDDLPEEITSRFPEEFDIDVDSVTTMSRLLGTYFSPFTSNGVPQKNGVGCAIRVRKGEYAFSTQSMTPPEGFDPDVIVTWSEGKVDSVFMSTDAGKDLADVIRGKGKKRVAKRHSIMPELEDVFVEDPNILANKLKVYKIIKGDSESEDEKYGHVTGVIEGKKDRDVIPEHMYPFLKEDQVIDAGGSIIRIFKVHVPEEELAKYQTYLQAEECLREFKEAQDELAAELRPIDDQIIEIKAQIKALTLQLKNHEDEIKQDERYIKAKREHDEAKEDLEKKIAAFNAI